MTECNGCGGCCDPVVLPYTQAQAKHFAMDPEDLRWTLDDLKPMPRAEAQEKDPDMFNYLNRLARRPSAEIPRFYSCLHFDELTRECTNYANRPPICRAYPWRGKAPVRGTPLPSACSFRADIGLIVKPRQLDDD